MAPADAQTHEPDTPEEDHPEATAGSGDTTPTGTGRYCHYPPCARPLAYDGRGRPPEYCPDRRWPDGRTCRQKAAADRAAERAAGLDTPLETFRAAGDRLATVAEPLAQQLTDLVAAVSDVRDTAVARMTEAEQAAADATARAHQAEQAQAQATTDQAAAETERDRARATADEAEQRAADTAAAAEQRAADAETRAERQIAEARREAEQQVAQAWQRVTEADHARGGAEAARDAADQRAALATHERDQAQQRADAAAQAEEQARQRADAAEEALRHVHAQQAADAAPPTRRPGTGRTALTRRAASVTATGHRSPRRRSDPHR